MQPDYYEILQVSPLAQPEVIQAAYRRLAFKYHPDRSSEPGAQKIMRDLNEANEVLRDPERRNEYDACRRQAAEEQARRAREESEAREREDVRRKQAAEEQARRAREESEARARESDRLAGPNRQERIPPRKEGFCTRVHNFLKPANKPLEKLKDEMDNMFMYSSDTPLFHTKPVAITGGYVYILTNPSYQQSQLKIGWTYRTPAERANELSRPTGVPTPFEVRYWRQVGSPKAEREIHRRLDRFRDNKKEFFILPLEEAIRVLAEVAEHYPLQEAPPREEPIRTGEPQGKRRMSQLVAGGLVALLFAAGLALVITLSVLTSFPPQKRQGPKEDRDEKQVQEAPAVSEPKRNGTKPRTQPNVPQTKKDGARLMVPPIDRAKTDRKTAHEAEREATRDGEWEEWQREARELEAAAREWEKAEQKRRKAEENARLAPIRAENAAASKLSLAKMLIADEPDNERLKERAIFQLEQLVKQYPETKAAAEAKKLIKNLLKELDTAK